MWSASWTLKWFCIPLSAVVFLHVGRALLGMVGFLGSEVVLFPVVSGSFPVCGGVRNRICNIEFVARNIPIISIKITIIRTTTTTTSTIATSLWYAACSVPYAICSRGHAVCVIGYSP